MSGLLEITSVRVPKTAVEETQRHLRYMGKRGFEGFVLWAGRQSGAEFEVLGAAVPAQRGVQSDRGVYVTVDGAELHRLNVWQHQNNLTLVAQVHSHPGEAYHSETDDDYAIATTAGSFSIVVPYFAAQPIAIRRCAVYRLDAAGRWGEIAPGDAARIFTLAE